MLRLLLRRRYYWLRKRVGAVLGKLGAETCTRYYEGSVLVAETTACCCPWLLLASSSI